LTRARADGAALGARLRDRDLSAAPAALNLIESRTRDAREQAHRLLAEVSPAALGHEPAAHIVGVTGPPGVGKSSLLSRLVAEWRARERSVAVLAVDPSSRRSGGSLLGDRARIEADPRDKAVFIRSTAAGERLGGLAPATRSAAQALADIEAALAALGARDTAVCTVSSIPPPVGIPELVDALDAHRAGLDLAAHRLRSRRRHALDEFVAEHGERGLRALGGRLEAERWLERQDEAFDVPSLEHALEDRAEESDARAQELR
jgi:LAO/AO transport system kinase